MFPSSSSWPTHLTFPFAQWRQAFPPTCSKHMHLSHVHLLHGSARSSPGCGFLILFFPPFSLSVSQSTWSCILPLPLFFFSFTWMMLTSEREEVSRSRAWVLQMYGLAACIGNGHHGILTPGTGALPFDFFFGLSSSVVSGVCDQQWEGLATGIGDQFLKGPATNIGDTIFEGPATGIGGRVIEGPTSHTGVWLEPATEVTGLGRGRGDRTSRGTPFVIRHFVLSHISSALTYPISISAWISILVINCIYDTPSFPRENRFNVSVNDHSPYGVVQVVDHFSDIGSCVNRHCDVLWYLPSVSKGK